MRGPARDFGGLLADAVGEEREGLVDAPYLVRDERDQRRGEADAGSGEQSQDQALQQDAQALGRGAGWGGVHICLLL